MNISFENKVAHVTGACPALAVDCASGFPFYRLFRVAEFEPKLTKFRMLNVVNMPRIAGRQAHAGTAIAR